MTVSVFLPTPGLDHFLAMNTYNPAAAWVQNGYGTAYRIWDGQACFVQDGELYRMQAFETSTPGGVSLALVPIITEDEEDFGEAFDRLNQGAEERGLQMPEDGGYVLVSDYGYPMLVGEKSMAYINLDRSYEGLAEFFDKTPVKGLIFVYDDPEFGQLTAAVLREHFEVKAAA